MNVLEALIYFLPIFIGHFVLVLSISFITAVLTASSLMRTTRTGKKESYEEAMSHYDSKESSDLSFWGIALDNRLEDDHETPDKYLGGQ